MSDSLVDIGYWKPSIGLLTGPIIWFLDQQISYIVLQWACAGGHYPGLFFYVIALIALALIAVAAFLCWGTWRRTSSGRAEPSPTMPALHFLGGLGLLINALFFLAIIAMAIPRVVLGPCQT